MRSVRIGRLAGIPIGVQPLWLLIVALITWSLGAVYYPDEAPGISAGGAYALGLASALLLFASILLHELGHSVVARRHGVEIEEIDLWLLGGVARMGGYPKRAGDELRFALAGPAVTLAIAVAFGLLAALLPASAPDSLRAVVQYQLLVNTAILVFNLLPAFPLDGGRVVRALLWGHSGDLDGATATAATVGRGFGYGMVAVGLLGAAAGAVGGIWFAVIGVFVIVAAKAEERGLRVRSAFSGREAGRFMSFPAVSIPASTSVEEAIEHHFELHRFTAFPVLESGRPVGLVDIGGVRSVPEERRAKTTVGEVALRDPGLIVGEHRDLAELIETPVFRRVGRVIVRGDHGLGIVSSTDVERALRVYDLRAGAGGARVATRGGI